MPEIIIHTDVLMLLHKQLKGETFSAEETARFEQWAASSPHHSRLAERLRNDGELLSDLAARYALDRETAWQKLEARLGAVQSSVRINAVKPAVRPMRKWYWAAAASILLMIGLAAYFRNTQHQIPQVGSADIQPGREGAILTLADGSRVSLDSLQNGVVALQGGTTVKVANGVLSYEGTAGQVVYNTISTPRGRQYQVTLPDGTQVWLNSASAITYPTAFTGKERRVKIEGEAYFEVARNAKMPFYVAAHDNVQVEVLGTHFNMNAYTNEESINTTLLKGSIRVSKGKESIVLNPGQQARVTSGIALLSYVDVEKVMAWKSGFFIFTDLPFEQAMRQLERWYDIDVVLSKGAPQRKLRGEVTKDLPLSGLLQYFEKIDIHYKLEGRKLIILP